MTKPIPDKAEVALELPDKLYIGTFERSSRFDAHLDQTGVSLTLHRTGDADTRKSVRMHFHYGLFADILNDLASTVASMPRDEQTTGMRSEPRPSHRYQEFRWVSPAEAQKLGMSTAMQRALELADRAIENPR